MLKENPTTPPMSKLRAYTIAARWEYLPGELMAAPIVLMLGVTELSLPIFLRAVEAFVAFLSFFFAGFLVNALTDYKIDKTYGTFKSNMPKAVDVLGKKTVVWLVLLQCSLGTILSVHLGWLLDSIVPVVMMVLAVFFGMGYSLRPFKFKERGVLSAVSLSYAAFFMPPAFLVYCIRGDLPLSMFTFFLGFAIVHYGLEFGNQANDYKEDKKHGLLTPPVRWGLARSLRIGVGLVMTGLVIELKGLWGIFTDLGGEEFSLYLLFPVYVLASTTIMLGYRTSLSEYIKMMRIAERFSPGPATDRIRELCKYSRWQISGISGALSAVIVLFLSLWLFRYVF